MSPTPPPDPSDPPPPVRVFSWRPRMGCWAPVPRPAPLVPASTHLDGHGRTASARDVTRVMALRRAGCRRGVRRWDG